MSQTLFNGFIIISFLCAGGTGVVTGGSSSNVGHDVTPRFFHKASVLSDGRVLVTGGLGVTILPLGLQSLSDVSVFDPSTNKFSRIVSGVNGESEVLARLLEGRSSHTQTTLPDGRVLIAGGNVHAEGGKTGRATASVEIFEPALARFIEGPAMNVERSFHTATRLADGRVVVAGRDTWQIFDPTSDAWSNPHPMRRTRSRHAAVLIPATQGGAAEGVLVIGGLGSGGRSLEWLDPATGTTREVAGQLRQHTNDLAAVRLGNGRVLIVGGQYNYTLQTMSDSYIFDPEDESLRAIDPPPLRDAGISDHEMIAIGNRAFVFGGERQVGRTDTELDYVAVFDGDREAWEFVGRMNQVRDDFAAVLMANERILLIDGAMSFAGHEAPTGSAEVFVPREIIPGDANGDGRVDMGDVSRFVEFQLWPESRDMMGRRAADMNGDFLNDSVDLNLFVDELSALNQ